MRDTTYIARMQEEFDELQERVNKLESFLDEYDNSPDMEYMLDSNDRYLLTKQYHHMVQYLCILSARIDHSMLKEFHACDASSKTN